MLFVTALTSYGVTCPQAPLAVTRISDHDFVFLYLRPEFIKLSSNALLNRKSAKSGPVRIFRKQIRLYDFRGGMRKRMFAEGFFNLLTPSRGLLFFPFLSISSDIGGLYNACSHAIAYDKWET